MIKIYLASPFFNDDQVAQVRQLEKIIEGIHGVSVYSPSRDGIKLDIKTSTYSDRKKTFSDNVQSIYSADLVVANIGNNDTGTYWEVGFARSHNIPVIGVIYDGFVTTTNYSKFCNKVVHMSLSEDCSAELVESIIPYKDPMKIILFTPTTEITELTVSELYNNPIIKRGASIKVVDLSMTKFDDRSLNFDDPDSDLARTMIIGCIDDRNVEISELLGWSYGIGLNVVTYSTHDFGVNIMLLHSIKKHCSSVNELCNYLIECIRAGSIIDDQEYVVNTKEFE